MIFLWLDVTSKPCRDLSSHEDESWVFNFFWDLKTSIRVELLCHLVYQQQQQPGSFVLHVMHRLKVTSIHVLQTLSIYLPLAHCLKMGSESWHVGFCLHSIESNNNNYWCTQINFEKTLSLPNNNNADSWIYNLR